MKENECLNRLEDLKLLVSVYDRLYGDIKGSLYKDSNIVVLRKKAIDEISTLESAYFYQELEDSYDQNTGK